MGGPWAFERPLLDKLHASKHPLRPAMDCTNMGCGGSSGQVWIGFEGAYTYSWDCMHMSSESEAVEGRCTRPHEGHVHHSVPDIRR